MSPVVVSGGATPFITNKHKPKGGVTKLVSTTTSNNNPNHSGSKPRASTIGIYKGIIIIIKATASIKQPKTNTTAIMAIMMVMGLM